MKIGMYTDDEIYETLANGFLQRSMVDAMIFGIKEKEQQLEQYKNIIKEVRKILERHTRYSTEELLEILNKAGD